MDPFVYQTVIGGAVFGVGLVYAGKNGVFASPSGRRWGGLLRECTHAMVVGPNVLSW